MTKKPALYGKMKAISWLSFRCLLFSQTVFLLFSFNKTSAVTRSSISSGNWNNAVCWSPAGIPSPTDDITISANHTITLNNDAEIHNITIATGGKLLGLPEKSLNITGAFTVNGTAEMNEGNFNLQNNNSSFTLGPQSTFIWDPGNNSSGGASLFIKGKENFHSSSTLIIRNWFDYSVPIGELITGNFGNLVINSPGGTNSIVEWNQNNSFQNHQVTGTLTIDQGWVTLDKSGSISSTYIGNIVLKSINSTLIAHSGTHPSSFTLTTGSVINTNGRFYGLNDGNGNVTIRVTGNFSNSGNVKIINNSGVSGVSNGNAVFRVDGDFSQSSGDTRIIYNVTTTNSGTFNATFKNLLLSGGIFMGQSGCHTGGQLNLINIIQDLSVNFSNATDKFRGNGLTSIGNSINNSGFVLNVGRNMMISGNTQAEFTSSASKGDELVSVQGDLIMLGCTSSFNYGTNDASHSSELFVHGNVIINGGNCFLSRNNGSFHSIIDKNLTIENGQLILKGNSGTSNVTVSGNYNQSGGTTLLHSNIVTPANIPVTLVINGTFKQTGGQINFDDNTIGAEHILSLRGDSCLLTGNGIITHAGQGTSTVTGLLQFDKPGKIYYKRTGNEHLIEQVTQNINNGCELIVTGGNIKLSSYTTNQLYGMKILPGGRLTLSSTSVYSNGLNSYCKILVDSSGIISLVNEKGLFGNSQSAIMPGVGYFLHRKSIVEYCGLKSQTITGLQNTQNATENKYGILRINMQNVKYPAIIDNNVYIRERLELVNGNIKLNNHRLTIENGNTDAVSRIHGYIESDFETSLEDEILCWKNMSEGIHEFPFGRSQALYLPIKYNLLAGAGNDVCVSTRRTHKNNLPYPSFTGILSPDPSFADLKAIDRWWTITAPGVKADITLTYSGDENTLSADFAREDLYAMQWNGTSWKLQSSAGSGTIRKTGTIYLSNLTNASHLVLVSDAGLQPFALKSFQAIKGEDDVLLNWETMNEASSVQFTVEKSTDGVNFYELTTMEKNSAENNSALYNYTDNNLPVRSSYYRIKLFVENNIVTYSDTKIVSTTNVNTTISPVKVNSVSPNPFTSTIKVQFNSYHEKTTLEVVDAQGKMILRRPAELNDAEHGYALLNLEYLKKGIYFLNIISNGKKETIKIIKNE